MVKEQYVSYEVAKLLHEKGFEINPELGYWKIGLAIGKQDSNNRI